MFTSLEVQGPRRFRPPTLPRRRAPPKRLQLRGWEAPVIVFVAVGLKFWMTRPELNMTPVLEPISLSAVEDAHSIVRIAWNRGGGPVVGAKSGEMEITDGSEAQYIILTPAMLSAGSYTYPRQTEDIKVQLRVIDASGIQVQGALWYAAQPSDWAPEGLELAELRRGVAELEREAGRLRARNKAQEVRIDALNRALSTTKVKLGIVPSG